MSRLKRLFPYVICVAGALTLTGVAIGFQTTPQVDLVMSAFGGLGPPRTGASIAAAVLDNSSQAATADVVFYRGDPLSGNAVEFSRQSIPLSGFTPTNVNAPTIDLNEGDVITACINPEHKVAESDYNNNCITQVVSVASTDLSVTTSGITISPVGVNVGEPMTVTASVKNAGSMQATTVVRLWQSHPQAPDAQLLGQASISIPGGGTSPASWTVVRPAGTTDLWVSVDDVYPRDFVPQNNLASRNMFLKAIINTGRQADYWDIYSGPPAVADLLGTGQPVMVFNEEATDTNGVTSGHITALQLFSDGTTKELWSVVPVPGPSWTLAPSIADLDGDGNPEIIVEATRNLFSGSTSSLDGEIWVLALDKNGNTKWSHSWKTPGRNPCHNYFSRSTPALGDMNHDGIVDITILEQELVILDGRNGGELVRKPGLAQGCSSGAFSAVLDLDGNGNNSFIVGDYGIHVFNSDGTVRWQTGGNNLYDFAVLDLANNGIPKIVVPVHRQFFEIFDARTGHVDKTVTGFPPFDATIAATSNPSTKVPKIFMSQNDYSIGTGAFDPALNQLWFQQVNLNQATDSTAYVALADLMGTGRPQVISHSSHFIGIQDSKDGSYQFFGNVFGGSASPGWPIPVDVDGDGHGEVIVQYGGSGGQGAKSPYDPQYPIADYLVFGSVHWQKIPTLWNHPFFQAGQVDSKLAWRGDYQPWKTTNSWLQQPLRKTCDIDYNDVVDQNDINLIMTARGASVPQGDPRDVNGDGTITVADARACVLKCTLANCQVIDVPGRILSVTPRVGFPGQNISVVIRGELLKFQNGVTTASFGPGISVGGAPAGTPGPVTVIDQDTARASLSILPGATGTVTVTLATGTRQASRPDAFALSAAALPPVVNAGGNQSLILPGSLPLNGSASSSLSLTTTWQQLAGPGTVTFSNASSLATMASFSGPGYYKIRLSATDGTYIASDDIGVTVIQGNAAPLVNAGQNQTTQLNTPLILNGIVTDDGLPSNTLSIQWTQVSGPGTVAFAAPTAAVTSVTFPATGTYQLALSANDTALSSTSTVTVTVTPPVPQILSLSPNSGVPGQQRAVTITGQFTNFVDGTTQASFGPGISVGNAPSGAFGPVTVTSPTTATAQISIDSTATLGPRTVTLQTKLEQAVKAAMFTVGAIGVPNSISLNLSDTVVSPGGSITANPQVLDAAGNVISGLPFTYQMTVAAKPGLALGNAPAVNNLVASFPKLMKRLLNWDQSTDPQGLYTDTDPTDPNYGKETGGLYTLTVSLQGTAISGSADVAVLPSGTADITLSVKQYADLLNQATAAAQDALTRNDGTALSAAIAQFNVIRSNPLFSFDLMVANNVITPVNGFPMTAAKLSALGFSGGADDATFSSLLDALTAQVVQLRTQLDAMQVTALTQAQLNTLQTGAQNYTTLLQQLQALHPSPLGVTQSAAKLNALMTSELPRLLDSMSQRSADMLNQFPGIQVNAGIRAAAGIPSIPYESFFTTAFSVLTSISGAAKSNVIELAVSLANDLANIAIADAVNSLAPGDLNIDFVMAGGQLSFVCPDCLNTYIEGTGFSVDIPGKANQVLLIGCFDSKSIAALLTLKPAKDLGAAIRLFNKVKGLASAMGRDQSIVATVYPDQIRDGLFDGSLDMVFNSGWPRVNQGRLPCVGIVIVANMETGSFAAQNVNMLSSCN